MSFQKRNLETLYACHVLNEPIVFFYLVEILKKAI